MPLPVNQVLTVTLFTLLGFGFCFPPNCQTDLLNWAQYRLLMEANLKLLHKHYIHKHTIVYSHVRIQYIQLNELEQLNKLVKSRVTYDTPHRYNPPLCVRVRTHWRLHTSHTFTVASFDPDTSRVSSSDVTRHVTSLLQPQKQQTRSTKWHLLQHSLRSKNTAMSAGLSYVINGITNLTASVYIN